jgi:hypothetical protein
MLDGWRDDAACHGRADLMDPPPGDAWRYEAEALELCGDCPVIRQCAAWVLGLEEKRDPGGVVGGMTFDDRKARRRGLRISHGMRRAAS